MEKAHGKIKLDRKTFIKKLENIQQHYEFSSKPIGKGTYGSVHSCKHKITGEVRAVKAVSKVLMKSVEDFLNEINCLKLLDHPNIIRLFEWYEDATRIYLVMEYCCGGELFAKISSVGQFTEYDAAVLFRQMANAVCYCTKKGICHKDLKPENFVFVSNEPNAALKLIDFGLSQVFSSPGIGKVRMSASVGTPYYKAPEVIKGEYDEKCDIWSLGVILYILLCGAPPFYGPNDAAIKESVLKQKFLFDLPIWETVSKECKDLIKRMLRPADRRLTAEQVLKHEWFNIIASKPVAGSLPLMVTNRLDKFRKYQKVKQAVLTYLATQLSEKEILPLRMHFLSLDKNGDGILSRDELNEGLKLTKPDTNLAELADSLDTNESGFIDYNEFLSAGLKEEVFLKSEKLIQAFTVFDLVLFTIPRVIHDRTMMERLRLAN